MAGRCNSEVCRIVSEEGRFPLTWVGLVDGKQVVPVACSGTACDYLKEVRIETEGELGNGPDRCLYSRRQGGGER